jgi:hypothetical protein
VPPNHSLEPDGAGVCAGPFNAALQDVGLFGGSTTQPCGVGLREGGPFGPGEMPNKSLHLTRRLILGFWIQRLACRRAGKLLRSAVWLTNQFRPLMSMVDHVLTT